MKCSDCPYCWKDADDRYPHCHYSYNDGYAPCEIEEQEQETPDDYYGD